jgi:hypothetical protein
MRKSMWFLFSGMLAIACLFSAPVQAQNAVCNPFFSTLDTQHWESDDPSLMVFPGSATWGMDWYCLVKKPGLPNDNGSISQDVYLIGGKTYQFSAPIAASYICPG